MPGSFGGQQRNRQTLGNPYAKPPSNRPHEFAESLFRHARVASPESYRDLSQVLPGLVLGLLGERAPRFCSVSCELPFLDSRPLRLGSPVPAALAQAGQACAGMTPPLSPSESRRLIIGKNFHGSLYKGGTIYGRYKEFPVRTSGQL